MSRKYDIDIVVDEKYEKTKITIYTKTKSKEIEDIIKTINSIDEYQSLYIPAYLDGKIENVVKDDIVRIRREGRQVILDTEEKSYILKKTLMQLEEELDSKRFLRISQSELINVYKVKSLDISVIGTIIIEFNNGIKSHASRRFVKSVKKFFEN